MAETIAVVEIEPMESSEQPFVEPAPAMIPGGMISRVAISPVAIVDSAVTHALHAEELALASALPETRRASFVAGRRALRSALEAAVPQLPVPPLLRAPRGGPQVPHGAMGSISHKRTHAIALAAPSLTAGARDGSPEVTVHQHVGIDLEHRPSHESTRIDRSQALARRILTARERSALASLNGLAHLDALILRFALKEAVYKSIDPYVQRYVRFTEVELDVEAERATHPTAGIAQVTLLLRERPPLTVHTAWQLDEAWIVATAISTLISEP